MINTKRTWPKNRLPKAADTAAPGQPTPPVEGPDVTAQLRDLVKSMCEAMTNQEAPQTPQQKRRAILQAAKAQVIDRYGTPLGQITASLRGAVKLAVERQLATIPLEELPFEEVSELVSTIRDECYAPEFSRQARETRRKNVEADRQHKKEVETLGAMLRAHRRKQKFVQQGKNQAHAFCQENAIIGWEYVSLLADVGSRLEAFLTGDEPILEAQAIVRSVLESRFEEAKATMAAARAKADAQWREEVVVGLILGAVVGLVMLSLQYPAQTTAIFNWIERIFGSTAGATADAQNPEASKTTSPASSEETRARSTRRRKYPVPHGPESPRAPSAEPVQGHA